MPVPWDSERPASTHMGVLQSVMCVGDIRCESAGEDHWAALSIQQASHQRSAYNDIDACIFPCYWRRVQSGINTEHYNP